MLYAYWIVWRYLVHSKSPMNCKHNSLFYHQSHQSIIKQQSLPDYLFDLFCSHGDFCSLQHILQNLDSHQSPLSISSAILHLNLFQSSPDFHHILECTSHTPDDTLLVYNLGVSAGLTLFKSDFLNMSMQHLCLWYFKGQWNRWNWHYYPQVCWYQGMICLLTTSHL